MLWIFFSVSGLMVKGTLCSGGHFLKKPTEIEENEERKRDRQIIIQRVFPRRERVGCTKFLPSFYFLMNMQVSTQLKQQIHAVYICLLYSTAALTTFLQGKHCCTQRKIYFPLFHNSLVHTVLQIILVSFSQFFSTYCSDCTPELT